MLNAFSVLREIGHSLLSVLSAAGLATGTIVTILGFFGVHVSDAQVAHEIMVVSGGALAFSKGTDSLNNALTTGPLGAWLAKLFAANPAPVGPIVPPAAPQPPAAPAA